MVGYGTKTKMYAKKRAAMARRRGLNATVFKKKKGWGVSITRK